MSDVTITFQPQMKSETFIAVYEKIFEYIQILEYFPPIIDICIRFVAILKAENYLNVKIFLSKYIRTLAFKNH